MSVAAGAARLGWPLLIGPAWAAAAGWRGDPPLLTAAGGVLAVLMAWAATSDAARGKIPNRLTYPAALWAIGLNLVATLAPGQPAWLGAVGLGSSLGGAAVCLAPMLPLYGLFGGGAGDAKLAAAVGALLGPEKGLVALGVGFIAAAIGAIVRRLVATGPRPRFIRMGPYQAVGGFLAASDLLPLGRG